MTFDSSLSHSSSDGANIADLYRFLEQAFERQLRRSPMSQASLLGRKTDNDKWDDLSTEAQDQAVAEIKRDLEHIRKTFDPSELPASAKFSFLLFEQESEQKIESSRWRRYVYVLNQMFGWQSEIPAFLINNHLIESRQDADAYIARLRGIRRLSSQLIDAVEESGSMGVSAPRFVYNQVIRDCRNLLKGVPFHATGPDSPLLADFKAKLASLDVDYSVKPKLIQEATEALLRYVEPAYRDLIACASRAEACATDDAGAWKFPKGDEYYAFALRQNTNTDLSANEIHEFGQQEVTRIHSEMRSLLTKIGFGGSLEEFFDYVRSSPDLSFPDTEDGRSAYLAEADRVIADMKTKLPTAFKRIPRADLVVKRVEQFRERSAGLAFYQSPSPDGSRPGIYYVNLVNMAVLKKHQIEALAYHEGIPGHHMQRALAVELEGVPTFQKFSSYTAFAEGWGLYAELLAKEMGAYQDPMSDFGRLVLELWRATRLVVDTGIHAMRWTREQAIEYLRKATPNPDPEIVSGVERYIVMPGQAVAYKIGMHRILQLREESKNSLGSVFSIAKFHDVVLSNGEVPLNMLSEVVREWIAGAGSGASSGPRG